MKYEVFIKPGFTSTDIEAESAQDAREQFSEMVSENIGPEHIVANNLDTDDGEDPK